MRWLACLLLVPSIVSAQDLVLDADVPSGAPPYFELPFTVPAGTVEIEVRHDDVSDANILDWGLRDPERFRGWGGGNTEPAIVGELAASRSYTPGPIPAGEWAVLIGQALVEEAPAHYRIEIFFRTAPTLAEQTERAPYTPSGPLRAGPAWYAGDFHVHSIESGDARPELDEIATFARSRGLDFVELSDHNVVTQADFIADAQARHPDLLFVPGIEVTTYFGHANAIGATEWIDFQVESGTDVSIDTILAATSTQNAVFAINHPVLDLGTACIGCSWSLDLPDTAISAIEIQNGAYSVTGALFLSGAIRFWEQRLAGGAHVAIIGGSDDHRAGVDLGMFDSAIGGPTTMVYADELSAEAIVRGVREGRTVVRLEAATDPMVELTAEGAMIGDTIETRTATLTARVSGGSGATLYFYRNGRALDPIAVDADPFEATLAIEAPPGELDDRYRCQLDVGGQPRVMTSHLYVAATGEPLPSDAGSDPGTSSGCGCRSTGADRQLGLGMLALLVVVALRRRRKA
jgi:MYXO-CTERM domain-containing protein